MNSWPDIWTRATRARLPRAELWLASSLLERAGLEDTPAGHAALRRRLGMDALFLPVAETPRLALDLGYRYFGPETVMETATTQNMPLGLVLDGPVQRLADRKGLMPLMTDWMRDEAGIRKALEAEAEAVLGLLDSCRSSGAAVAILTDDLAGDRGTYFHPDQIAEYLDGPYRLIVNASRRLGAPVLLHSCGDFSRLLPWLGSCGFEGLAAVQTRVLDPAEAGKALGEDFYLLAGIEAEQLQADSFSESEARRFKAGLERLTRSGRLMLCSSAGLYSPGFLERLERLYGLADGPRH